MTLIRSFSEALPPDIPLIFESSVRKFAALVSDCNLFVTSDSGPMHLACAVGVRTVAIFQNPNFNRWGPPANICRIVHQPSGCSVEEVLKACQLELSSQLPPERAAEHIAAHKSNQKDQRRL